MSLNDDYAAKIRRAADKVDRLAVDRHDPARYHEMKSETVDDLRKLANAVEIDQVFVGRPSLTPEPVVFRAGPRHVVDRKGRPVAVEVRRRIMKVVRGTD